MPERCTRVKSKAFLSVEQKNLLHEWEKGTKGQYADLIKGFKKFQKDGTLPKPWIEVQSIYTAMSRICTV